MTLHIGVQVLESIAFGLVFSGLHYLIAGWNTRLWLAHAAVLAGLAWIILFGVVKL